MTCGQRVLTLVSLGFGLLATGTLALAVATDYWIFTSEPLTDFDFDKLLEAELAKAEGFENSTLIDDVPVFEQDEEVVGDYNETYNYPIEPMEPILIVAHSGLWRMCLSNEAIGSLNSGPDKSPCTVIDYLHQDWERIQGADATWSILRAIRKASPVIVFSLILLIIAFSLSTVGNARRDSRTITGSVIYVFSALCLAVGVILYISAVNDEVAHRKKPNPDGSIFEYHYGWAFFFASGSFVLSLMAAVSNISLYLKRFPTIEDMVKIIPGLDKKHNYNFSKISPEAERIPVASSSSTSTQNPTLIL